MEVKGDLYPVHILVARVEAMVDRDVFLLAENLGEGREIIDTFSPKVQSFNHCMGLLLRV